MGKEAGRGIENVKGGLGMGVKNKSAKKDTYKSGKMELSGGLFIGNIVKNPELFYNSDEFRKMKNRKKGNRY